MSKSLVVLNGVALTGCAIFLSERQFFLIAALLFLPLLDQKWEYRIFGKFRYSVFIWLSVVALFAILFVVNDGLILPALSIIFFIALPEEWFFRCYFLQRLESFQFGSIGANICSSSLFALLHVPTQGVAGLLTFFPSLLFGYIFQQTKNLALVVCLHTLANLAFVLYFREFWLRF